MPLFTIICLDRADSLELRMATRSQHLEFLGQKTNVKLGGPFLDPEGKMIGSMMIIEAADLAEAQAFAAQDPYAKAGLFQSSEVRAWRQTVGAASI